MLEYPLGTLQCTLEYQGLGNCDVRSVAQAAELGCFFPTLKTGHVFPTAAHSELGHFFPTLKTQHVFPTAAHSELGHFFPTFKT